MELQHTWPDEKDVSEFPTACQCHDILWVDLRLE
jgi:hypothetical protein